MGFSEEIKGNIFWRRPNEYIHEYYLTKEIISRYPFKNTLKIRKFVYETYSRDSCPIENIKHNRFLSNELKSDFSSENKRNMKIFFKVFDKNDFYIVKYFNDQGIIDKNKPKDNEENNSNTDKISKTYFSISYFTL